MHSGHGESAGRITLVAVVLIAAYYVGRFHDCTRMFFALDDFWVLRDAADVHIHSVGDLGQLFRFGHNGFTLYRPLTTVTYFYVLRLLFGYDASGYHAVQLLAHVANALLVYGIARRLSASALAGLAVSLVYAAAPGHIGSIYPLCNFVMTGTTTAVFLMIYVWLRTAGIWRAVSCTVLQTIGLLASEHALAGPLLLSAMAIFRRPRESRQRVVAQLAGSYAVSGAYVAAKLYYFTAMHPLTPEAAYAVRIDSVSWLRAIGRYAAASVNALSLLALGESMSLALGVAIAVLTAVACWRALLRGEERWNLVALGCLVFVIGLLPVLPLARHFYAHYIGIAALGTALLMLGSCRLLTQHWRGVAMGIATALIGLELVTAGRATRTEATFQLYRESAAWSARWVYHATHVGADVHTVLVPRNVMTTYVFDLGHAQQLFATGVPSMIQWYELLDPPSVTPGTVVLSDPPDAIPAGGPLPGWQRRWEWLR